MNNNTISKVNRFGKIGNIIITVLLVVTIIACVALTVAAAVISSVPDEAVSVTITKGAEINVSEKYFGSVWNNMVDSFAYTTDNDNFSNTPPEETQMDASLSFFNNNFSSALISSSDGYKTITASSDPAVYHVKSLTSAIFAGAIFMLSAAAALFMLKKLFKAFAACQSPFCDDVVKRMKNFSFSLIPVAVFASLSETLSSSFLSAGQESDICIQWGIVIAFAVAYCLCTVFKYGVQLQRESDETL